MLSSGIPRKESNSSCNVGNGSEKQGVRDKNNFQSTVSNAQDWKVSSPVTERKEVGM